MSLNAKFRMQHNEVSASEYSDVKRMLRSREWQILALALRNRATVEAISGKEYTAKILEELGTLNGDDIDTWREGKLVWAPNMAPED